MSADDETALILARSVRRVQRAVLVPAVLDKDDLAQEGAIALLLAKYEARSEPETAVYRTKRATGAMLDAVRRARASGARRVGQAVQVELEDAPDLPAAADQADNVTTLRAVRAALSLPHPLPLIFAGCLAGLERTHLAAHLGISAARVSQHVATIRVALAEHLETP